MNDSNKLSRRDWFRLRVPRESKMLSEDNSHVETEVLQPIEQPPNHDGMDLSELPPMREAVLSARQVNALFTDIEQFSTDITLMQRSTTARSASAASVSKADTASQLSSAQTSLLDGQIPRIQIRYRWQDALWIDTLQAQSSGYRLVRIEHRST